MLSVAKAHAFGNDFLFVPAEQAEGLKLDELSRRLCNRHTGLGGDGVIYYTTAPDGSARMKLINTDGSPSELSGNGLRCLAALVLHQRVAAGLKPVSDVRVDTDAGWKTLALVSRQGAKYTFRAAMGAPERVATEQIDAAGESLTVTTLAIGNPQCVALMKELPDQGRFHRLGPALATHPRFPAGTNVELEEIAFTFSCAAGVSMSPMLKVNTSGSPFSETVRSTMSEMDGGAFPPVEVSATSSTL